MPESDRKNDSMQSALAGLNRTIHEPARLAILTVLAACEAADFVFLQTATGLSKGNLSVQLTRLEEAALIIIEKTIEHKRNLTMAALTTGGRGELARYWVQMENIRAHADVPAKPDKIKKRREAPGGLSILPVA